MITYIVAPIALAALVRGAPISDADSAGDWDDFANNFATDIAPIVVLFGEQVTKQFLSESTSTLDHIIFAVAPLGVLTAVVSVIRVCGNSSLKAFIGRAQEAHGVSEAELCSSTSRDVCELWSNSGISRIFGRPKILEFVFSGDKDFYVKFPKTKRDGEQEKVIEDDGKTKHPSCGIYKSKAFFCPEEFSDDGTNGPPKTGNWKEVKNTFLSSSPHSTTFATEPDQKGSEHQFAPHPNLSLNVGIRPPPRWIQWLVAIFGVLLQLSFFGYATWASYYASNIWKDNEPPDKWAFPLAALGTGMLVIGMGLCAMLIDRRTHERRFEEVKPVGMNEKTSPPTPKTTMFWLQPGNQSVGDQVFNSFAHWERKDKYITSWRVNGPNPFTTIFAIGPAIMFSTLGFIFQFIGLRGLHGSVALYQLAATLIMAVIRAALRSKRIDEGKNRLKGRKEVEGHELDWIALQIEKAAQDSDSDPPKAGNSSSPQPDDSKADDIWHIVDLKPASYPPAAGASAFSPNEANHITSSTETWKSMVGFLPKPENSHDGYSCVREAMRWIEFHEKDEADNQIPNKAARTLYYRNRLARLTDSITLEQERPWDTPVRVIAGKLKEAIEETAKHIFSGEMELSSGWKGVEAVVWSSSCFLNVSQGPTANPLPIHFLLYRENGRWTISKHQLEAALGLWRWSLETQPDPKKFFSKKVLGTTETGKKEKMKSVLLLWIDQMLPITESEYSYPSNLNQISELQPILSVSASTFPQTGPKDQTLLSVPSTVLPLELLAQDIFSMFISRISGIIEPLNDIEPRGLKSQQGLVDLTMLKEKRFLGLAEENIDILVDEYIASGLGTREDAFMSIIPSFLYQQKLPAPEEIAQNLARAAKSYRRSGDFQKCDGILRGLFQLHDLKDPAIEKLAIRNLGELYRSSIRSQDPQNQQLGRKIGVELMKINCFSAEAKKIQQHYTVVVQYCDNIRNRPTETPHNLNIQEKTLWEGLEKDLEAQDTEIESFALLLTIKYNVNRAKYEKLERVIKWAIEKNNPELIEDLWEATKSRSDYMWRNVAPKNGNPLFWAVEVGCEQEAFQSIIEWPDVDLDSESKEDEETALLVAVKNGRMAHVQKLLDSGAWINARDSKGANALHIATAFGHDEIVELLLKKGIEINAKKKILAPEGLDRTAVHIAASKGNHRITGLLIDRGADVSSSSKQIFRDAVKRGDCEIAKLMLGRGISKSTLTRGLKTAALNGYDDIVKILLENDASPDIDIQGAVSRGHHQIVSFFLQKGANVAGIDLQKAVSRGHDKVVDLLLKNGASAAVDLRVAASNGHHKVVELLLERGVKTGIEIDEVVSNGHDKVLDVLINYDFAVHGMDKGLKEAASNGHKEVVKILLEKAGKVNIDLRMAASSGHHEVIELFLQKGADLSGLSVGKAASKGHSKVVELLLKNKAVAEYKHLESAVSKGHYKVVELLLQESSVGFKDGPNGQLLLTALYKGHQAIAELLLRHGADPNARDEKLGTALGMAADNDYLETVELLLKYNADVNAQSEDKNIGRDYTHSTALNEAISNKTGRNRIKMVELLLEYSANVNAKYKQDTMLVRAIEEEKEGRLEIVKLLLEKGADVNCEEAYEGNALNAAVSMGDKDLVELLLDRGADINARKNPYRTALGVAAGEGRIDILKFLINKGAEINIQGGPHGNALNVAVHRGFCRRRVIRMLLDKGAQIREEVYSYHRESDFSDSGDSGDNFSRKQRFIRTSRVGSRRDGGHDLKLSSSDSSDASSSSEDSGSYDSEDSKNPKDSNDSDAEDSDGSSGKTKSIGHVHRRIIKILATHPCQSCRANGLTSCKAKRESCKLNWIYRAEKEVVTAARQAP
ncbi:hypothetical protein TWF718_008621 [Orbilia javanica]|uniref:Uncharacterized protein n=1 Tax=Orbilia javanica TaxID=47235 RepID=A0AAN8RGC9_9PEZI